MYIYLFLLGGTVVEAKGDEMTRCGCMYMYICVSRKWGQDAFFLFLNVHVHVLLMYHSFVCGATFLVMYIRGYVYL